MVAVPPKLAAQSPGFCTATGAKKRVGRMRSKGRRRKQALCAHDCRLEPGGFPPMRCLNCHTALMATDSVCPSCRMAAPNVVLAPRQKGLLQEKTAVVGSMLARVPGLKWVVGLFLFLVAGAVILLALGCFFTYQSDGERGPREVTADELRNLTDLNALPDPWISYSFPKASET